MRHDTGFKIIGDKVVLVPYRKEHVAKYHNWMENEDILRLTGSDRLTLSQEYDMQISWAEDTDKCTFIILDKDKWLEGRDEVESMVGDTNLFLNVQDQEDQESEDGSWAKEAEIEIMIAESSARRKGFASEALRLMMQFGGEKLGVSKYVAKIKDDNSSSVVLFQKLGFVEFSRSDVFREISLVLTL